jgi:hypothetical protein
LETLRRKKVSWFSELVVGLPIFLMDGHLANHADKKGQIETVIRFCVSFKRVTTGLAFLIASVTIDCRGGYRY